MTVSVYLKGDEKYPDVNYATRLKEFSQVVNPKPGYVAPRLKPQRPVDWKVSFHVGDATHTVEAQGIYMDAVLHRAANKLPYGILPEDGGEVRITLEAIKR